MEDERKQEISRHSEGQGAAASPTPVGDDLSDFELAEQRFKASWTFDSADATPGARTRTAQNRSGQPKRRIRASLEGRTSTPIKLSRTPGGKLSPAARSTPRRSLSMPEKVVMERPSIWIDVAPMLVLFGLAVGMLWLIYAGVDGFWED